MTPKNRFARLWDIALTPLIRAQVEQRRLHPDGKLHRISHQVVGGVEKNVYPWDALEDGDFFIVPLKNNENSMRTSFRQGAARHDMEIKVDTWFLEGPAGRSPALRVTRIQGNIHLIRAVAHSRDDRVGFGFNVRACAERVRRWRDENKPLAFEPQSQPQLEPGTRAKSAAEFKEQQRRKAAGLESDELDYFGGTQ